MSSGNNSRSIRCQTPVTAVGPRACRRTRRFDRGPLAKLTHGETEQAPHGKPTGLSPPTSRTTCPDGLEGGLAVNPALPQAAPSPTHRAVSDGGVLLVG